MLMPHSGEMGDQRLYAISFVMTRLLRLDDAGKEERLFEASSGYRLILVLRGKPEVQFNRCRWLAEQGSCFLVSPGEPIRIRRNSGQPYAACLVSFSVLCAQGDADQAAVMLNMIPDRSILQVSALLQFVEAPDMEAARRATWAELAWQQRFLALLTALMEQRRADERLAFDPRRNVERTIEFLQQNYSSNVTVQSLADMAELPRWQYLRVFKQLTGSKPSSYITQLRMEQAKILLSSPDAKVWEIAHQVGYHDEQYFNRRFKLVTGTSPGQYARLHNTMLRVTDWRGNIRSVPAETKRLVYDDASTLGDLLVLGISPVGANLRYGTAAPYADRLKLTEEVGFPVNPDKVRSLKPDLVLLSRFGYEQCPQISGIAPTVGLNEYAPMHRRVQKLGEIFGMRDKALTWLKRYDQRCENIWMGLQSRRPSNDTVAVWFYDHNGRIYLLHRRRGLSKILYHPLGFRMDERLRHMRPKRDNYYIAVDPDRIQHYALGSRLFVFYRTGLTPSTVMKGLRRLPGWEELPAVQAGKIHCLDGFWNGDDAITSQLSLDHFADLWS